MNLTSESKAMPFPLLQLATERVPIEVLGSAEANVRTGSSRHGRVLPLRIGDFLPSPGRVEIPGGLEFSSCGDVIDSHLLIL